MVSPFAPGLSADSSTWMFKAAFGEARSVYRDTECAEKAQRFPQKVCTGVMDKRQNSVFRSLDLRVAISSRG
jgi:hypothetical protein